MYLLLLLRCAKKKTRNLPLLYDNMTMMVPPPPIQNHAET
jgi:hypothetical protein